MHPLIQKADAETKAVALTRSFVTILALLGRLFEVHQ